MIIRMKDLGDPMPPAGKDAVPDELIAELENWIRRVLRILAQANLPVY